MLFITLVILSWDALLETRKSRAGYREASLCIPLMYPSSIRYVTNRVRNMRAPMLICIFPLSLERAFA